MPVFHAPSHCASHRARGEKALARLVEQVNALRARPVTGEDFEEMEREFRALFAEAEREVVGETLERLDVDLPFVEIEGRRYPASCIKFLPIHAFTARNTGFSGRSSVRLKFTASEDKPHAIFVSFVQNRTESFTKRR